MIQLSSHFRMRVDERFATNHYDKESYVVETFKNIYKKYKKGKAFPRIEKTSNQYWEVYRMWYQEFKFVYSVDKWDITLITFWLRSNP